MASNKHENNSPKDEAYLVSTKLDILQNIENSKEIAEFFLTQNGKLGLIDFIVKHLNSTFLKSIKIKMISSFTEHPFIKKLDSHYLDWVLLLLDQTMESFEIKVYNNMFRILEAEPYDVLINLKNYNFDSIVHLEKHTRQKSNESVVWNPQPTDVKCINLFELVKLCYYTNFMKKKDYLTKMMFKEMYTVLSEKYFPEKLKKKSEQKKNKMLFLENKLKFALEEITDGLWEFLPELDQETKLKYAPLNVQLDTILSYKKHSYYKCKMLETVMEDRLYGDVTIDGSAVYIQYPEIHKVNELPALRVPEEELMSSSENSVASIHSIQFDEMEPLGSKMKQYFIEGNRIVMCNKLINVNRAYPYHSFCVTEDEINYLKEQKRSKKNIINFVNKLSKENKSVPPFDLSNGFPLEGTDRDMILGARKVTLDYKVNEKIPVIFGKGKSIEKRNSRNFICAACGYFIYNELGIEALGVYWHLEHFVCGACNIPLRAMSYTIYKGIPFCQKHFKYIRLQTCDNCNYLIAEKEYNSTNVLYRNGKFYHLSHYACSCGRIISKREFKTNAFKNRVYCDYCVKKVLEVRFRCFACKKLIGNKSDLLLIETEKWHSRCFNRCLYCGKTSGQGMLTYAFEYIFCKPCKMDYEVRFEKKLLLF